MTNFRSAPCRYFTGTGQCHYGTSCRFSHSPHLRHRPLVEHTPCFRWEETGTCSYGQRCVYSHRELPRRIAMDQHLGAELDKLDRRLVAEGQQHCSTVLSEVHELSSYSWLQAKKSTIAVPGRPTRCLGGWLSLLSTL